MDSFSDKFQYYLDLKGLKIADVQRFSGLNLTTLYKMLDGSRVPAKLEVVERIAESLCLNSEEREDLIESYYLTRLGPIGYYGRREVRKFYNNINRRPVEDSIPFLPFKTIPLEAGENMVLKGKQNVDIALEYFVYKAAKDNPGVTVNITEFFEDNFMLSVVANVTRVFPQTQFVHTLRIDEINSENVENQGMYYNVRVLGRVLSFAARHANYKVCYRYTDVETERTQMSHLSCLILAGEYAIQYSPDHRYCVVERNRSISDLFGKISSEDMGTVSRLIYRFGEDSPEAESELYHLFHYPVIGKSGYMYDSGYLTHPYKASSDPDSVENFILKLSEKIPTTVMPRFQIENFASDEANGTLEERAERLEELAVLAKKKRLGIATADEERFPDQFFSAITLSTLYIALPDNNGDIVMLAMSEPTIVHAFYDFIDNLYHQEGFSTAETVRYLERKIRELRERDGQV